MSQQRQTDLDRRQFIKKSVLATGGAIVGNTLSPGATASIESLPPHVPNWTRSTGPGVGTHPYGMPSSHEAHVIRRTVPWLTASPVSSVSFTPLHELDGIITPNGVAFERHHAGMTNVNPEHHRLIIHGLVERPLVLTMDDIVRFPSVSKIHFIECAANGGMEWRGAQMEALQFTHGMLSCCEWTGVPLSTLLSEVGVKPEGQWILAEGADGAAMTRSIPLQKALQDTLIVYAQNGEKLRPEQGYPLRLLNPGWEGNTSIKWLRRLKVGDQPWYTREETSKYTDLMPDGRARKFSWVQECNSVITFPCPEKPLRQRGFYEIRGLAWSGRGKIKRVDISFDGGANWTPARLKGLVLDKALTRFGFDWRWDGSSALIQSRAVDETGYVQPSFADMRVRRGVNSIYHRNAIHTWQLAATGEVKNVQID